MKLWNRKQQGVRRWALGARLRKSSDQLAPGAPRLAPPKRRGILLLVALSLLVLFLLVGTAFVVTARHSSRTAITVSKANQIQSAQAGQADLLDDVLKQIVRDTNNPNSSLRNHSLLRDMYGNDGFTGSVPSRDQDNAGNYTGNYRDSSGLVRIPRPTNGEPGPAFPHTDRDGLVARWAPTRFPGASGGNKHLIQQSNITAGQILEIDVLDVEDLSGNQALAIAGLKRTEDAYNGLSLTFTSGPAEGITTRIVDYLPPTIDEPGDEDYLRDFARFRLLSFRQADGSILPQNDIDLNALLAGSRFVVNGRPFNGTGIGFNEQAPVDSARLNTVEMNLDGTASPLALVPNAVFDRMSFSTDGLDDDEVLLQKGAVADYYYLTQAARDQIAANFAPGRPQDLEFIRRKNSLGIGGLGGSDEGYDAADFQNMLLGLMPQVPIETTWPNLTGTAPGSLGDMVLPSLHRPALINYFDNQVGLYERSPTLLRKTLLRPSWFDHPNFTGSNPELSARVSTFENLMVNKYNYSLNDIQTNDDIRDAAQALVNHSIYGPWDVDNDNDGVRDSVWVDFGAPVMSMPDGTLVKPLAAVLCLDMDGRLNVNAHGSVATLNPLNIPAPELAGGALLTAAPKGLGVSTTEISLIPVLGDRYDEITYGTTIGTVSIPGKYGIDNRAGSFAAPAYPGHANQFELKSQLSLQGVAESYQPTGARKSQYGSPIDMHGKYSMGLNDFGQPFFMQTKFAGTLNFDYPFEIDLTALTGAASSTTDTPFSINELERSLRAYDIDAAATPDRLATLGDFLGSNLDKRNLLTTDSWDLPVPSVNLPRWVNVTDGTQMDLDDNSGNDDSFIEVMGRPAVGASFADLIEYRFRAVTPGLRYDRTVTPNVLPPLNAAQRRAVANLIPRDLAKGAKLDINRALGNGRDDDNDGVVDEPGEVDGAYWRLERGQAGMAVTVDQNLADGDPANEFVRVDPAANNRNDRNLSPGLARDFKDGAWGAPLDGSFDTNGDDVVDLNDNEVRDMSRTGNNAADVAYRVRWDNLRRQELAKDLYITAVATVDPFDTASPEGQRKLRKLAQWAINVVDYRDADSIMTPFEFDLNPFEDSNGDGNPWDVDGVIDSTAAPSADDTQPHRALAWGLERPELVISESLAWHDPRVSDEADEATAPGGTSAPASDMMEEAGEYDQLVRPRGAWFLELYNPWPQNSAASADVNAFSTSTHVGVDLGRTHDRTATGSPVWRVAVSIEPADADPREALEPQSIERSLYFSRWDPSNIDQNDGDEFWATIPTQSVRPGRYMVVGGAHQSATDPAVYEMPIAEPRQGPGGTLEPRRLILDTQPNVPEAVRFVDEDDAVAMDRNKNNQNENPNTNFRMASPPDDDPVDTRQSYTDVAIINEPRRMSLSEPAGGYPGDDGGVVDPNFADHVKFYGYEPTDINQADGAVRDIYPYGFYGIGPDQPKPHDIPLDSLHNPALLEPGTGGGFARGVFLQRLANPLLPFDADTNPYRTVDYTTTNLTVFNSRERGMREGGPTNSSVSIAQRFLSTERGWVDWHQNNAFTATADEINPWAREKYLNILRMPGAPPQASMTAAPRPWPGGPAQNRNRRPNAETQIPDDPNTFTMHSFPDCTLGFLNRCFMDEDPAVVAPQKLREPKQPFPWLAWNNRPYISAHEVMQVPTFGAAQLLRDFTMKDPANANAEIYRGPAPTTAGTPPMNPDILEADGPYQHLANFHRTDDNNGTEGIAGLHRMLDYLHVPSRFVGTEEWLNPVAFSGVMSDTDDPRHGLQVPFNKVSLFREPGQVNLNTIADDSVLDGLFHRNSGTLAEHPGPTWAQFVNSRRVDNASGIMLQLGNSPTFFENPYRTADAGDFVPPLSSTDITREGADATMLRRSDNNAGTLPDTNAPALAQATTMEFNNADRNPWFRYQPTTRLDNLVTTRSNVYSIWVTVGFFEVEAAPTLAQFRAANDPGGALSDAQLQALYDRVYPEGYQLGREYGIDVGQTRRLRGFSIVDRSIPVGFEPGHDHNTREVVRLQRQVE